MKRLSLALLVSSLLLSGCVRAEQARPGLAPEATLGTTTNKAIPPLEAINSTIDCTGWADGAQTYIRQQGRITIRDTTYDVATFACGIPNSELGTEFIESFIYTQNVWASNGLVSGPELQFMTTGECNSDIEIVCPGVVFESTGGEVTGNVIVFEQDGGLAWRFDAS